MSSVATFAPASRGDSSGFSFPDYTTTLSDNDSARLDFGPRGSTWEPCNIWFNTVPGSFAQASFLFFCLSYMAGGNNSEAVIYGHVCNAIAFISMLIWASMDICAPDIVVWSLALSAAAIVQVVMQVMRSRKLDEILNTPGYSNLYHSRFSPFGVSRQLFSELVTCKGCESISMKKGEQYALEGKSRVDRISILMSGRMSVFCKDKFLHYITANTFVDSPEWDSMRKTENSKMVFKVTITADCDLTVITWKRKGLSQLLNNRNRLATLFQHQIGRDITSKLTGLNDRYMTPRGFRYDIRLPCIISLDQDIKRRQRQASTPATPGSPVDSEGRKHKHKRMGKTAAAKYSNILAQKISDNKQKARNEKLRSDDD